MRAGPKQESSRQTFPSLVCYFSVSVEKKFLLLQEETLQELRRRWEEPEGRNYLVCPELECPVCLVEMVPPTRIWQCRSTSANIRQLTDNYYTEN